MFSSLKNSLNDQGTTERASRHSNIFGIGLASIAISLSSGCSTPPMGRFDVDAPLRETLPSSSLLALSGLEEVEAKLLEIEDLRQRYNPLAIPLLLINKSFQENYDRVLAHHRDLLEEVANRKKVLIESTDETKLSEALEWGAKMNASLSNILAFIKEVERRKGLPDNWEAPSEFSYLHAMLYR